MSDPKELRRNAQDCLTHARAATDAHDKFLLLNMAEAWLKLSQQVEQLQAKRGNGGGGTRRRRRPRSSRRSSQRGLSLRLSVRYPTSIMRVPRRGRKFQPLRCASASVTRLGPVFEVANEWAWRTVGAWFFAFSGAGHGIPAPPHRRKSIHRLRRAGPCLFFALSGLRKSDLVELDALRGLAERSLCCKGCLREDPARCEKEQHPRNKK